MSLRNTIIQGSVLDAATWAEIPDQYVQTCITSPPYWGLRDYKVDGQIGLEGTPEEYIERMVDVFSHVWRVLRDDGTLWLNMGDCYVGGKPKRFNGNETHPDIGWSNEQARLAPGVKAKDMVGMPWRLALALQDDGWYLRRDIIWHKPNPMPESAKDRCYTAHEYLFHLTKKAKYFYDGEAIKEPCTGNAHPRGNGVNPKARYKTPDGWDTSTGDGGHGSIHKKGREKGKVKQNESFSAAVSDLVENRNKRSVWTIPTCSYKHAHFATFPPKLVEPCILAGTSAKGCCPECGKPWVRVVERTPNPSKEHNTGADLTGGAPNMGGNRQTSKGLHRNGGNAQGPPPITTGWEPQCGCGNATPLPCICFDPFMGSGTVAMVAKQLGRDYLGIELNPEYLPMIDRRVLNAQPPLFTT